MGSSQRLLAVILFHTVGWATAFVDKLTFNQETCDMETINTVNYEVFYPIEKFRNKTNPNLIEMKVRFKGIADGHIALTSTEDVSLPHYVLVFGSYNNQKSEIRRSYFERNFSSTMAPVNTPGILNKYQFRGFIIRYNSKSGTLSVTPEGNDIPLLFWKDPIPLQVAYFGFSTWTGRTIQVAFNCHSDVAVEGDALMRIKCFVECKQSIAYALKVVGLAAYSAVETEESLNVKYLHEQGLIK